MPHAATDSRLLQTALTLHDRVITIDTHVGFSGYPITTCGNVPRQVDLPGMAEGGLDVAFFTVYVDQTRRGPQEYDEAQARAREIFRSIRSLTEICPGQIELA